MNDLADEASGFLERMTEGFKANFTGDPIKKALDKQNLEETNQQLGEMGNLGSLQGLTGGTAAGILGVAGSFVSLGAAINAGLGPLGIVAQLLGIIGDALGSSAAGPRRRPPRRPEEAGREAAATSRRTTSTADERPRCRECGARH